MAVQDGIYLLVSRKRALNAPRPMTMTTRSTGMCASCRTMATVTTIAPQRPLCCNVAPLRTCFVPPNQCTDEDAARLCGAIHGSISMRERVEREPLCTCRETLLWYTVCDLVAFSVCGVCLSTGVSAVCHGGDSAAGQRKRDRKHCTNL